MLRTLFEHDPELIEPLRDGPLLWEPGADLDRLRVQLRQLLEEHGLA